MDYYEKKRQETLERIERLKEPMDAPETREKAQTLFMKVDDTGEVVEPVLIEHLEGEEPEETDTLKKPKPEDQILFKPKFDRAAGRWIEGLSSEEVFKRLDEIKGYVQDQSPKQLAESIKSMQSAINFLLLKK